MDYEIPRCTRQCHVTGREIGPGEAFYSVLAETPQGTQRQDISIEAWQGPPPDAVGWWKTQREEAGKRAHSGAPNDVVLDFFERLETQPEAQDLRYVLALFLIRRRVFRMEETEKDEHGREVLVVECPRRETTYRVTAIMPEEPRVQQIQDEISRLLQ